MRIVVHGQQAFGKAVLEALLKRGENVVAVYVAPEKPGAKADPLKEAAVAAKLPVYQPASYRKAEVWEEFRALKPDLQVMAFVTLFVPGEFLNIPTKGSIQYHPSLLPKYRGPSAINWPIIQGETETGLSIFWPDNGLDTGEVLLQKKTHIGPDDSLGSVYFDRRLHRRLRRRPHQSFAHEDRRRPQSRGRRIRHQCQAHHWNEARMTPTQATAAKAPITASQHLNPRSDIELAQAAKMRPIADIAREKLGI